MTRLLVAHKRASVPVCDICLTGISVGHAPLHGRFQLQFLQPILERLLILRLAFNEAIIVIVP